MIRHHAGLPQQDGLLPPRRPLLRRGSIQMTEMWFGIERVRSCLDSSSERIQKFMNWLTLYPLNRSAEGLHYEASNAIAWGRNRQNVVSDCLRTFQSQKL